MDHEIKTILVNMVKPGLLKIQKLASHGGGRLLSQLVRKLKQENRLNPGGKDCSELRLHHYVPAWATKTKLCQKKKKKRTNRILPSEEGGKSF